MQLPTWKKLLKSHGVVFVPSYIFGFFLVLMLSPSGDTVLLGDISIFGLLLPFGSALGLALTITIAYEIYRQFK